ncbi:MAG: hypothetical protein WD016_02105 [Balneolaceae bacterium]
MPQTTIKTLRKISQKGTTEPYWISRYFVRPFSIYLSYVLIKLKVTPNTVTLISAVFALIGSFVLIWPSKIIYIVSASSIFLFFFLDHVDGELARYYSQEEGNKATSQVINISGKYFDRVFHYFQGASFYTCLGAGLSFYENSEIWVLLGVVAGLGSSGFPRFTACFDLLNVVKKSRSKQFFEYIDIYSRFNVVHFSEEGSLANSFTFPRSLSDLILIGRQMVGFPGNITLFFITVIINSIFFIDSIFLYKLYLSFFSIILFLNTIYSLGKYLRILKGVPR